MKKFLNAVTITKNDNNEDYMVYAFIALAAIAIMMMFLL